ncbi:UNVERIFIED_ORG: DNA-binding transcriptional LysR family regulator [Paraburkholderia sediminicola]|nr:DNA-binding transcriptional LysR family regulator [Paraburkholderia sediminicola]
MALVVEAETFTRTSEALGVSSAVSRAAPRLEKRLGIRLL